MRAYLYSQHCFHDTRVLGAKIRQIIQSKFSFNRIIKSFKCLEIDPVSLTSTPQASDDIYHLITAKSN